MKNILTDKTTPYRQRKNDCFKLVVVQHNVCGNKRRFLVEIFNIKISGYLFAFLIMFFLSVKLKNLNSYSKNSTINGMINDEVKQS
jgi:hypothetical protein